MSQETDFDYDYIIVGSGFGGSVSALRLSEKGYKVLIIEKGKWLTADDFPKSIWNIKRWLWLPWFKFFGFFKMSFFRHLTILSHVGVGGGSLGYAAALPTPPTEFFLADTWSHLADWKDELREYYGIAMKMLGSVPNPLLKTGDKALQDLSRLEGIEDQFEVTNVGIFFDDTENIVPDPFFDGMGPDRFGCNFCGGCMVGCRYNAKNTLDKNYLYLAQKKGAEIQAESKVYDVHPLLLSKGRQGYRIRWKSTTSFWPKKGELTCSGVIFAGGVLGTVELLLNLKQSSLPQLSDRVGYSVRTNSESLIGITTFDKNTAFCNGVSIGSKLHADKYSYVEPVSYPSGSGFWRLLMSPLVHGNNVFIRLIKITNDIIKHPIQNLKTFLVWNWAKRTQILLFMQTLDSTLRLKKGIFGLHSAMVTGKNPTAFIPKAKELSEKYARIVNGKPTVLLTETLLGRPTTAHIFGGAVMGENKQEGVVDKNHRVFGYPNMYICDGSVISTNPGVNPSLTITALTERAMSKIPPKMG